MTSIKKTGCPVLKKGLKTTRKTVALGIKMLLIRKMEAGEKRKLKFCHNVKKYVTNLFGP
jgi:hypothetical protein